MFRKLLGSFCLSAFMLAGASAHGEEISSIDLQSTKVLRQAVDYIASLKTFTYNAQASIEVVSPSNEKLTYSSDLKVSIKRPNKIFVKKSGYENLSFFFNGSRIVGFNPKSNEYSMADESGDIDALVKDLGQHQIEAPMSEFIISEPFQALVANVVSSKYLGVVEISGQKYHHIAFRQDNVDWQLWVDTGATPLIKKFQVTSKSLTGSPSYSVFIKDWQSNPELNDSIFEFKASDTARLVDFKDLNPKR